jgi:uncharacterized protein (TIGR00159 family)
MLQAPFELQLTDIVDMLLVAAFLWAGVAWLRKTRARLALLGILFLALVYLAARGLELQLTAWILQGFFAVSVIVVVVVFQEDLRRFFEQIAVWGLRRRPAAAPPDLTDVVVRGVARLASGRRGALLVLPGREPLDRHVEGGISLRGRLSEALLLSLFDPHSPGHDGAIVLSGSRVERFAVHLPLSHDYVQLGPGGTRHAAALGLAERTDALCIVVSEERGVVSVAREARLRTLSQPEALGGELRRFLAQMAPAPAEKRSLWQRLGERWLETLFAVGLALGLWLVFVPGSTFTRVTRSVDVTVENLPEGYTLEAVDPPSVKVTLSGRRRDVYLANSGDLAVAIDALLVQLGRRTFQVSPAHVSHPDRVVVVAVRPGRIRLSVGQTEGDAPAEPSEAHPETKPEPETETGTP